MSVNLQPLHPDDATLRPVRAKPLTADQVSAALNDGEQVDTSAAAKVDAKLYAGVDPTIGDNGIITSMTVKPVVDHKADLRAQIDGVVNKAGDTQPTQVLVADMQSGGGDFNPGGAMAGSTYIAPNEHAKDGAIQQPKPEAPKPPIIIGGV